MNPNRIKPLAQDFQKIAESPDPKTIYAYTPGLAALPNGGLILTMEFGGPGVPGSLPRAARFGRPHLGSAYLSHDGGHTWRHVVDYPISHSRPFAAGTTLYILGQDGDLAVIRSDDMGQTWTEPRFLTHGESWHQSACSVWYDKGCVYLVMERVMPHGGNPWPVSACMPVLMRAPVDADLTLRESWTFARSMTFEQAVNAGNLDWFGVPFYPEEETAHYPAPNRGCAPIGWLETNVVKILDPSHYWHDPTGSTFHLFARAHTGGTGYCAVMKAVERADGTIDTMCETVPSGRRSALLPMPGGQMRFHLIYDEPTKLYWLLSSQATDSMTRAELLGPDRYNLPNNERHRLQLHFSRNCVDWCFAGIVAIGETPRCSRHYASMLAVGEDLLIASRSGDTNAASAHNGNFISLHRVRDFRSLVY